MTKKTNEFYVDSAQGFISCSEMCIKHKSKNKGDATNETAKSTETL